MDSSDNNYGAPFDPMGDGILFLMLGFVIGVMIAYVILVWW